MFTVVTPPVKPSLPVAVDLAKMEKDVGGSWMLVPFNEDEDLDALEREITAKLAEKAGVLSTCRCSGSMRGRR